MFKAVRPRTAFVLLTKLHTITMTILLIIFISLLLNAQVQNPFGERQDLGTIDYNELKEISGMAAGRINSDLFWLHNDSGNDSKLFAIDRHGKLKAVFNLEGIKFYDTEDIALGPGPEKNKNYIYLADIGDNDANRENKFVYRFPEPIIPDTDTLYRSTISSIDILGIHFPDGKRDAETIMIDPVDMNILIASKREKHAKVYSVKIPTKGNHELNLKEITELPFGNEGYENSGVTGGDISPDGNEILLKTYSKIYYYKRQNNEPLTQTFLQKPIEINYTVEPQGEAICFGIDNEGFYTTSERSPFNIIPHLYFYPRISTSIDEGLLQIRNNKLFRKRNTKFLVYTSNGRELKTVNSIKNLRTGLYFIKYTDDDTAFFRKILLVK